MNKNLKYTYNEMDKAYKKDSELLQKHLLEKLSNTYTGLSAEANDLIVECCLETFSVSKVFIEAYLNTYVNQLFADNTDID